MRASILTLALSLTLIPATLQAQSGPNNFPTWVETYHQVTPDPAQFKYTPFHRLIDLGFRDTKLKLFGDRLDGGSRSLDQAAVMDARHWTEVRE